MSQITLPPPVAASEGPAPVEPARVRPAVTVSRRLARRSSGLALLLERRLGVTVTGVGLVMLVVLGYLLARRVGNPAMYLVADGLAFLLAAAFLLGRRRLALDVDRSDLPRRIREGQTVDAEVTLHARRRISTIVVEEELPPALGLPPRIPLPVLAAGQAVSHHYRFRPKRRGVYSVGPLVATWSDPFGLTKKRRVLADAVEIVVHPSVEPVHDRVLARAWEDPPIRPPVSRAWPSGFEFYGMQDYQPGDDPRRIVWRATARTLDEDGSGRYLVRVAEQGITDRVTVLLDGDTRWHAAGEVSATFETAVRVVASIAVGHLKDGFAVTVETNACRLADAARGQRTRVTLLDDLARVQRTTEPIVEVLDRMLRDPRRDSHVVVVTPYLEAEAATRLRLLMNRGVSLLVALIVWEDSEPDSLHRAGGLGCNIVEIDGSAPLATAFRRIHGRGGRS